MRTSRALSPRAKSGDEAESERASAEPSAAEQRAWCRSGRRHKATETLFPPGRAPELGPTARPAPVHIGPGPAPSFLPGAISSTLLANPLISFEALPSHHADGPAPRPRPPPPSPPLLYFYRYSCSLLSSPLAPHRVGRAEPAIAANQPASLLTREVR